MSTTWPAPLAPGPVVATVGLPGSKSMTNRALVLAALADEPTVISGALIARDADLMIGALRSLGVTVERDGTRVEVTPGPLRGGVRIDCGLAGTVMRFLPPVAALADGRVEFDGDARARERPLAPLVAALRALGADVFGDALPLTVHGRGAVPGGAVTIDSSASSQFVSGLLLAAPRFQHGLALRHRGAAMPSLPHVEMTVAMLRERGVRVTSEVADTRDCRWQVSPGRLRGGSMVIEPDLSNAGPFLVAALVTAGEVTIPGWPAQTTQAGDRLRGILTAMGADLTLTAHGLTVRGPDRIAPVDLDMSGEGELLPTVAAAAAFATGPSRLRGLAHVRGHETDRLAALARELQRLGAEVTETPDGLVITPRPLRAAVVECYDDHRMATFGAIVGLQVPGVALSDVATTAKTMPGFAELWRSAVLGPTEGPPPA